MPCPYFSVPFSFLSFPSSIATVSISGSKSVSSFLPLLPAVRHFQWNHPLFSSFWKTFDWLLTELTLTPLLLLFDNWTQMTSRWVKREYSEEVGSLMTSLTLMTVAPFRDSDRETTNTHVWHINIGKHLAETGSTHTPTLTRQTTVSKVKTHSPLSVFLWIHYCNSFPGNFLLHSLWIFLWKGKIERENEKWGEKMRKRVIECAIYMFIGPPSSVMTLEWLSSLVMTPFCLELHCLPSTRKLCSFSLPFFLSQQN